MPENIFFIDRCPHCKKNNRLYISYLGHEVRCEHCGFLWEAKDEENESLAMKQPICVWNYHKLELDGENLPQQTNRPR